VSSAFVDLVREAKPGRDVDRVKERIEREILMNVVAERPCRLFTIELGVAEE
jgi:hypothetical protein